MIARTGMRLARVLGPCDESWELLDAAEARARTSGCRGALGAVLRTRGVLAGGEQGVALLREAVTELEASPLGVDLGWALHDLGALLRRLGRRGDAREPLRAALDVATRAEAQMLARLARDELAASGARPVRAALSGPASGRGATATRPDPMRRPLGRATPRRAAAVSGCRACRTRCRGGPRPSCASPTASRRSRGCSALAWPARPRAARSG